MKKFYLFALLAVMLGACGCENKKSDDPQQPTEQPDLSLLTQMVKVTDNWVWSGKPQITISVENPNKASVKVPVVVKIATDKNQEVTTVIDSIEIASSSTQDFVITTSENLEPGIYRAGCFVNGKSARTFNFAIDPFQISSPQDKPSDFDEFWQAAKEQLAGIDMNAQLTEIPERSTAKSKVYLVEMYSIPDGLSGEPVKIRGYYCEPQDGKQHPVILHFYGYDTQGSVAKVDCPYGGDNAELYLSHRGQYLNNRPAGTNLGVTEATENIYGDWFRYNLGDKDSYYYRGAYMDVVQAVRFMATRETSDMTKLFAEGSSQGGALTYACAALSDYPFTAIAANVAFMGDFADAKDIESLAYWLINDHFYVDGVPQEVSLRCLPYFDTKHLTPRISCAVLASSGLADDVCPARLNIVPFNNLATPADKKEYIIEPEMGHSYPANWGIKMNELFSKYMY